MNAGLSSFSGFAVVLFDGTALYRGGTIGVVPEHRLSQRTPDEELERLADAADVDDLPIGSIFVHDGRRMMILWGGEIIAEDGSEVTETEPKRVESLGSSTTWIPRGFPRPRLRVDGYRTAPAPYVVSSLESPGSLDSPRTDDTVQNFLCALCGLEVTDERCGIATGEPAEGADTGDLPIEYDHGLTHLKCADITVRMCPAFRDGMSSVRMAMWTVDTATLRPIFRRVQERGVRLGELGGVIPLGHEYPFPSARP